MFLNEGFSDYISKPIELSALEHILRKFIPKEKMLYAEMEIQMPPQNTAVLQGTTAAPGHHETDDGIDRKLGITYCGGQLEDYLEIVRIYCAEGEKTSTVSGRRLRIATGKRMSLPPIR